MGGCAFGKQPVVFEIGMLAFEIACRPHALSRIHNVAWMFGAHSRHLAFARSGSYVRQMLRTSVALPWDHVGIFETGLLHLKSAVGNPSVVVSWDFHPSN